MTHRHLSFLVNPTSGGRTGHALFEHLSARYPGKVHDIRSTNLAELCQQLTTENAGLIACGGDGTVSYALDTAFRHQCAVPVGIIPLGTGNDLSRHLGWGKSAPAVGPALDALITRLSVAPTHLIDRWTLSGPDGDRSWFNYWSIGIDAAIALRFHQLRKRSPQWFRFRWINFTWYGALSLSEGWSRIDRAITCSHLDLSSRTASLLVANIPLWAGGVRLPNLVCDNDGLADILTIGSNIGMTSHVLGLRPLRHAATTDTLTITTTQPLPMQCDGEPFLAAPGTWQLRHAGQCPVLAKEV